MRWWDRRGVVEGEVLLPGGLRFLERGGSHLWRTCNQRRRLVLVSRGYIYTTVEQCGGFLCVVRGSYIFEFFKISKRSFQKLQSMEDDSSPSPPHSSPPAAPISHSIMTSLTSTLQTVQDRLNHHSMDHTNHSSRESYDGDDDNRAKHFNRGQTKSICWFDPPCEPLSIEYFFSVRGQDGFHVYLWIMKDLSWVQAWYWPGLIFGILTLTWSAFMLWRACWRRSLDELWTHSAQFMWLLGNFFWMQGELHDYKYPNEPSIYNHRANQAGYIFIAALIWISIYYCIAKPLNITSSREVNAAYDTTGFKCRFPYFFQSWREYENVHILFWIGKDCFWCWFIDYMWVIFFIPTLLIAFDFCYVSLRGKNMVIDHAHYISQLLWVSANATWGAGEFWFSKNHDSALSMTSWNRDIRLTFRWYSAWVVVSAYVPLIILYLIWIPSTIIGRIEDDEGRYSESPRKSLTSSKQSQAESLPRHSHKSLFQQTCGRIRAWSGAVGIQMSSSRESSQVTSHDEEKQSYSTSTTNISTTNGVMPSFNINPIIQNGEEDQNGYETNMSAY